MTPTIDLNADLGEGGAHDADLIRLASSVNIACGGHAGNAETMSRAIDRALASGTAIGAHPGYEDRESFGRKPMALSGAEVEAMMERQIEGFLRVAGPLHAPLHHVKPHGALYLQACGDPGLADAVARSVTRLLPGVRIYAPPGSALATAADSHGLVVVPEGFADRRYQDDGHLVPRSQPLAVIDQVEEAVQQAFAIITKHQVTSLAGNPVPLPARTLCVHGDGASSVTLLATLRTTLEAAGIRICRP